MTFTKEPRDDALLKQRGAPSLPTAARAAADGSRGEHELTCVWESDVGAILGGVCTLELLSEQRMDPSHAVRETPEPHDLAAPLEEEARPRNSLVLPLQARGRTIGQIRTVRGLEAAPFDARDVALARSLAAQAALAIVSSRHDAARAKRTARAASLASLNRELREVSGDFEQLLHLIAVRTSELCNAFCVVAFATDGHAEVLPVAFHGLDDCLIGTVKRRMLEGDSLFREPLLRRLQESDEAALVPVLSSEEPYTFISESNREFARLIGMHSLLAVPLETGIRVLGTLLVARCGTDTQSLDQDDVEFAQQLATRAALCIEGSRTFAAERAARDVFDRANAAFRIFESANTSESLFVSFFEAAPDAVVLTELDGTIALVNAKTEKLFGYIREELLGRSIELLVPNCLGRPSQLPQATFGPRPRAVSPASSVELLGRRKDGSEFYGEVSSSSLQTEQEVFISRAIRDISDRIQAEVQQARLASIVAWSDDAIVSKTLEGIVTSWNEGARRIFGYTAEEMIGQSIAVLVPPGREEEEPRILAQLKCGQRVEMLDTVRRRKDGVDIHVSLTSSPLYDSGGRLIGASKLARDITARRREEEAIASAKDSAEAANRELEAFSYSVAHDLRAPLRGMNGFARLLLDTYCDRLDDEGRDWLQEIVMNAQKMGSLIDALLELARVTRLEPKRARVDLSGMASSVIEELAAEEPKKIPNVIIAPGVTAIVDPVLARVLVENLLRNAWKFTSRTSSALIEFGSLGGYVFVRDNGAGFDMAFADKLFKPFQRLHAAAQFPGTGIGLATVQRIVARHGGRVWAESAVDRGATFYFSLPERSRGSSS